MEHQRLTPAEQRALNGLPADEQEYQAARPSLSSVEEVISDMPDVTVADAEAQDRRETTAWERSVGYDAIRDHLRTMLTRWNAADYPEKTSDGRMLDEIQGQMQDTKQKMEAGKLTMIQARYRFDVLHRRLTHIETDPLRPFAHGDTEKNPE